MSSPIVVQVMAIVRDTPKVTAIMTNLIINAAKYFPVRPSAAGSISYLSYIYIYFTPCIYGTHRLHKQQEFANSMGAPPKAGRHRPSMSESCSSSLQCYVICEKELV